MITPPQSLANLKDISRRRLGVMLAGIFLIAAVLRFWGAFYDLPYVYHPDEPVNIDSIQAMVVNADPNPHDFRYPSLLYDVNALAAFAYFGLPAMLSGRPISLEPPISITMGATFAPSADAVALFRSLTICAGLISVLLVYLIGCAADGARAGLIAASLMAISPLLVADCRFVTPDSYVVLFFLVTVYFAIQAAGSGRVIHYLAAGMAVGATAASKYNGALVCVCVIVAHIMRYGLAPREWWRLLLAGLMSAVTFLVLTPFAVLDFHQFMAGWTNQVGIYADRHDGMDGNSPLWYTRELWISCGIAVALALAQAVRGLLARNTVTCILAAFAIVYFSFISTFNLRNDRTLLPMIPCVLLLGASFFMYLVSPESILRKVSYGFRVAVLAVTLVALAFTPLRLTIERTISLTKLDSRATAREWINSQLPPQALIAVESYSPFVNPGRFRITQAERAIDRTPEWYATEGVNYIVLSEGIFGRYFNNPGRYPNEIARYLKLMDSFDLVRRFSDGGYRVYVYKARPPG